VLHVLIILALALARLPDVLVGIAFTAPLSDFAWIPIPATLGLWTVFHVISRHAARTLHKPGGGRRIQSLYRLLDTTRWASLLTLAAGVFAFGWDVWLRAALPRVPLLDELLIASPVLLTLIFTWWSMAPVERAMQELTLIRRLDDGGVVAPLPTRWQSVWQHTRFTMLLVLVPISLMVAWHDTLDLAPHWLGASGEWLSQNESWLSWLGIACILMLTPVIMRAVWDTVPLEDSALRDRIRAVCDAHGVRVTGPLVWRTHGSMVNGAILGVFWPARYLLLTDALLERMAPLHLDAIVAHEVAHVRKRHMLWLGIVVTATAVASGWLLELVYRAFATEASAPIISVAATPIAFALALTAFVLTSQRFEWQADAFSVQHLARTSGHEHIDEASAATVAATLGEVAHANGMSIDKVSLRHGSIATRQHKARELVGKPITALPIDRLVKRIKIVAAVTLVIGLAAMLLPLP
jgi:Zn-dependent protease with chaperone function